VVVEEMAVGAATDLVGRVADLIEDFAQFAAFNTGADSARSSLSFACGAVIEGTFNKAG
jgi:hypothetical protein